MYFVEGGNKERFWPASFYIFWKCGGGQGT
jgi:hypothetical protein